jgi:hypothetical protein
LVLFIVESNMIGKEHSSINAAVGAALLRMSDQFSIELHFWGDRSQYDGMFGCPGADKLVQYHPITVVPGRERRFIRKVAIETLNIIRILWTARRKGASVLFLSVFAPSMATLMLLRRIFRSVPAHIILHSLEGLVRKDKWKITSYGLWNRLALLHGYDGAWPTAYVLGSGIRTRLLDCLPGSPALQKIRVIEHPFSFSAMNRTSIPTEQFTAPNRPICVGFVGFGRKDKGVDKFYKLAEMMSDLVESGAVKFLIVGSLDPECLQYRNKWVLELHGNEDFVDALQYRNEIHALDCAVYFLDSYYALTASGSLFDAIDAGVKVISLKSPYVEDIQLDDTEDGITSVSNLHEMEQYLRTYYGAGFRWKFKYERIKAKHGIDSLATTLHAYLSVP